MFTSLFLSVLVCFALEDLVSIIRDNDNFYKDRIGAAIIWLQALNCFFQEEAQLAADVAI